MMRRNQDVSAARRIEFRIGINVGDVIVEYNGRPVQDSEDLVSMVVATKPGTTVPLTVYRDNKRQSLNITIDERAARSAS